MKKLWLFIFTFQLFVYACNNTPAAGNKVDTIPAVVKQTDTVVQVNNREMSYAEDTFGSDTIDTKSYAGFPYRDSGESYGDSYIDTFTEAGIPFRIVHERNDTDIQTAIVERYANGQWVERILFERLNHTGDFRLSDDVNRDGYKDITRWLRFTGEVYFFNPKTKDFVTPASAEVNYDIYLIDSQRNIFCDMQEYKQMAGQITSKLYTFKDYKRYDLYELEFYNHVENNSGIITKLVLSKCIAGLEDSLQTIKEIQLPKPIDIESNDIKKYPDSTTYYWDYRKFWKEQYQKLP